MNLTHVSASQVSKFTKCPRAWFAAKVLRLPEPTSPALERGKAVHSALEAFLRGGAVEPAYDAFVTVAAPFLPSPGKEGSDYWLEAPMRFPVVPRQWSPAGRPTPVQDTGPVVGAPTGGTGLGTQQGAPAPSGGGSPAPVEWVGFIDYLEPLLIRDYKTRSDFKYNLTSAQIAQDVQMMAYGYWYYEHAFPMLRDRPLFLQHLNLSTRGTPKALAVSAKVCFEQVQEFWHDKIVDTVARMVEVARTLPATPEGMNALEPGLSECQKFGGCPHRATCAHPDDAKNLIDISALTKKPEMKNMSNSLEDMMRAAMQGTTTADEKPTTNRGGGGGDLNREMLAAALPIVTQGTITSRDPQTPTIGTGGGPSTPPMRVEVMPGASPDFLAALAAKGMTILTSPTVEAAKSSLPPEGHDLEERLKAHTSGIPITPPDMPAPAFDPVKASEEAMARTVGEVAEPAKKRGRPKKEAPPMVTVTATHGSVPLPMSAAHEALSSTPRVENELTLYIGCAPLKGEDRDYVMGEDFVAPIMENIARTHGVADARLIKFEWQNLLSAAIRACAEAKKLPSAIVLKGFSKENETLQSCLIPYAYRVVMGF